MKIENTACNLGATCVSVGVMRYGGMSVGVMYGTSRLQDVKEQRIPVGAVDSNLSLES